MTVREYRGKRLDNGEDQTAREQLIEWGYPNFVVDGMSDEECQGEVEVVESGWGD